MESTTLLWNGPVCQVCNRGYLGQHTCRPEHLRERAEWLLDMAAAISAGEE